MNNHCGIVLIDKPRGITSARCVGQIKRILGGVKVGHGGTLDPDATGLLVLFVGKATTLCDLIMDGEKGYEGEILAGRVTSTDDISGEILRDETENAKVILPKADLSKLADHFKGDLLQAPPQVSAVKIDGKRAYLRARNGDSFVTSPKQVHISNFTLTRYDSNHCNSNDSGLEPSCLLKYRIQCSKGFYVRSLARDLGEYLGCGATVVSIRRTLATPFSISDACRFEDLSTLDSIKIIPWDFPFQTDPILSLSNEELKSALNGQQNTLRQIDEKFMDVIGQKYRNAILTTEGITKVKIGLLCYRAGKIHRYFFLPEGFA